jgi:hypothetical protein
VSFVVNGFLLFNFPFAQSLTWSATIRVYPR